MHHCDAVPATLVRRLAVAAPLCLALLAGTASARDDRRPNAAAGDVNPGPGPSWWEVSYDPYAIPSEPTGGACFYGSMDGDAQHIASELGFAVREVYDGFYVADPAGEAGMFDAVILCTILNGSDPYTGAEPDFFMSPPEGSQSNGFVLPSSFGRAQFLRQPAFAAIRTRPAHRSATGAGVTVAVIDSGVDADHSWTLGRVLPGMDFVDGDDVADDVFGHGTTVAGLVLAAAPQAVVLPVRVLDADGLGTASRVAAGIRFALDRGADVINLSLGAVGFSQAIHDEIVRAQEMGVIVVAAAGNVRGSPFPDFPASEWGVIAATGNIGAPGDVWAPAANVAGPYPGERWFRGTGTSFAAALVSGGVALAAERSPDVTPIAIRDSLPQYRPGRYRLDLTRLAR